jgi:hypothetical protein
MLHTCWCIVFECLNSNLCLNSFGCLLLKIWKSFPFLFSLSLSSGLFSLWAQIPEAHSRPSYFSSATARHPLGLAQPASPARPNSADSPTSSRASQLARAPRQAAARLRFQPSSGPLRMRCRPLSPTGGTRLSSPLQPSRARLHRAATRVRLVPVFSVWPACQGVAPSLYKPPPYPLGSPPEH